MDNTYLYLLNAVNGADVPVAIPSGYGLFDWEVSPNGRCIAGPGWHSASQDGPSQTGLWLYNTNTGAMGED